jgi:hypothetical protein
VKRKLSSYRPTYLNAHVAKMALEEGEIELPVLIGRHY